MAVAVLAVLACQAAELECLEEEACPEAGEEAHTVD